MSKTEVNIQDSKTFEKQQIIEAIKTVVMARWYFVTVAIIQVVTLQLVAKAAGSMTIPRLFLLAGICYGYNFIYWLFLRRNPEKISDFGVRVVRVMQVAGDMLVISLMLYFDRTVTIFVAAFYLDVVLIASVIYKKLGIFLTTITTCLLYTALAYIEYLGFFPPMKALYYYTVKDNPVLLVRTLIIFFTCMAGAGFLSGYIAALFRKREQRMKDQRDELIKKTEILTKQSEELKKAKLDEETEKNEVEAVIRNLTAGLIMLDPKKKVILVNNQAENMLGVFRDRLTNRKLTEVKNDNLAGLNKILASAGNGQVVKKQLVIIGPLERYYEVSTAAVLDPKQKPLGQIIVLNDISREKELDKTKAEFITITAHQLRTPLSGMKWALGILLDQDLGKINAKQRKVLQQGFTSNEKMIELISDLLNLTTLEEGRFTYNFSQASLADITQNVINDFQTYLKIKRIKIDFIKPKGDNFETMLDQDKIKLVVQNLIENAINYSPANTTVTVTLERENNDLLFSVKDTGVGVPEREKTRLFTKFFRGQTALKLETEGNGLGLYLSKNIIDSHHGKIWYESQVGQGSTFYFRVPAG